MFRCERESCGKSVEPRQPQHTIVVESRDKTYERKIYKRKKLIRVEEILGSEIVKEIKVCPECYQEITGEEPRKVQETTNIKQLRENLREQHKPKPWKNRRSRRRNNNKKPVVHHVNRHRNEKAK